MRVLIGIGAVSGYYLWNPFLEKHFREKELEKQQQQQGLEGRSKEPQLEIKGSDK